MDIILKLCFNKLFHCARHVYRKYLNLRRIQNPVEHLRWQNGAFHKNTPSYILQSSILDVRLGSECASNSP